MGWFTCVALAALAAGSCEVQKDVRVPLAAQAPRVDAAVEAEAAPATEILDAGSEAAAPEDLAASRASPGWASGSVEDRLRALRVTDGDWARRDLVTWTTPAQVDALRRSRVLLVATARAGGPPSPFVWLVARLSRRAGPAGALARLLSEDPRFQRRRYAWTAAYATVLGLSGKRYGNELVAVRLREDALVVALAPERDPPVAVRGLDQREVPIERALDEPARIGAVYHVRTGKDVPARFREYVLVNEAAIERWAVGTADVHAEIDAEAALLRDLWGRAGSAPAAPRPPGVPRAWSRVEAESPLAELWEGTLAFPTDRYRLDAERLKAAIEALGEYDRGAPPVSFPP